MNSHRYLWFLIATIIVLSCSEHFQPETNSPQLMRRYPIITKSDLDAAVWDDRIQMNIFPYEDKYSLAIFQAAYDSLSKDSRNNGFIAGLKLKPTHRALIIRPKDEKQQRSIEQNQLLMVRCNFTKNSVIFHSIPPKALKVSCKSFSSITWIL